MGVPNLIYNTVAINDTGGNGNGNGDPDPGETGVQIFVSLTNNGAATSTGINAVLSTTTPGVTVTQNTSAYPNIAAAGSAPNSTAYVISLGAHPGLRHGHAVQPGGDDGARDRTTSRSRSGPASRSRRQAPSSTTSKTVSTAGPRVAPAMPGARPRRSPTARPTRWTDSPAGNYANNVDSWLQSPVINLAGKTGVSVSGFFEVRPRGRASTTAIWSTRPMAARPITQLRWPPSTVSKPTGGNLGERRGADNQANARLRLRFLSDLAWCLTASTSTTST